MNFDVSRREVAMDNNNARAEDRELNILVVDDSAMMRAMIKRVVEICDLPGAHVLFAGNGKEALQVLAEKPVSAVLLISTCLR